jgi:hypothetical protein
VLKRSCSELMRMKKLRSAFAARNAIEYEFVFAAKLAA